MSTSFFDTPLMRITAIILVITVVTLGIVFRDHQYRLNSRFMASDQTVLDHRDSVYTSMTWVASNQDDYMQLRFFDKVEGGVCMRPTWDDLIQLAKAKPGTGLDHLVPTGDRPHGVAPGPDWTYAATPDPGTLPNSAYVRLFPIAPLMIDRIAAAGPNAKVKVLVVGLGSGTGIAVLAHHFPGAAITVIDIDERVIHMVRDHFPLIDWLATQKLADGTPRLQLDTGDARQFIRFHPADDLYDVVILDAYTAGSTIPSHLMTREFYKQCADILTPDGVVLANVIGSVTAEKHRVLGGAIRTFRAGGLTSVIDFPVLQPKEAVSKISLDNTRNNIIVAAKIPIEPEAHKAAWARLKAFVPYPQLALGTYTSHDYLMCQSVDSDWLTAWADAGVVDTAFPAIQPLLGKDPLDGDALQSVIYSRTSDSAAIGNARQAVLDWANKSRGGNIPYNWDGNADTLVRCDTDWVAYARETFRTSVDAGHDITKFGGDALVGPDYADPLAASPNDGELIPDAPLFTDQRPNGDIVNR